MPLRPSARNSATSEQIAQFANRQSSRSHNPQIGGIKQKAKKNKTKTKVSKRAAQKATRSAGSRMQRAAQVRQQQADASLDL